MSTRSLTRRVSLLVRNLPMDVRADDVRSMFERYGEVRDVYLPQDFYTRKPKGFGFVEFLDNRDAEDALYALDRTMVGGREISVVMSKESRKTPRDMIKREDTYSRGDRRDASRDRGGRDRGRDRSRERSTRRSRSRTRSRSRSRDRDGHHDKKRSRSASRDRSRSRSPRDRDSRRHRSASPADERANRGGRTRDEPKEDDKHDKDEKRDREDGAARDRGASPRPRDDIGKGQDDYDF